MRCKHLIIKNTILNWLPFSEKLRQIKRKLFGYKPDTDNLDLTIENYERIKLAIEQSGGSIQGATVLEIGSGWFPVIPILLIRDGAKKVLMSDLNPHMDAITFNETTFYLKNQFPKDQFIQNLSTFEALPVEYLAPFDVSTIHNHSVDLIVSRTVLEHIPKSDLYTLFFALKLKLSNAGFMVHLVDHTDHFEHVDKSISKINFLTWNEAKHTLINYLINGGENRMRHHEYQQIFTDAGYQVENEETDLDRNLMDQIQNIALVYPYSKMEPEQLAVVTSIYTVRPS